jgi:hypothetical protein
METLNKKTLSFPLKNIARAVGALTVMFLLAACPGNGNKVAAVNVFGCQDCAAIVSPVILSVVSSASPDQTIQFMNMNLYAEGSLVVPNASGNNYNNYRGPIALQGQMIVTRESIDPYSGCVIFPGTYDLTTYSAGSMEYASSGIRMPLMITNTGGIEIRIDNGYLHQNGSRLYAQVSVTRVNGYACSPGFTNTCN